MSTGSRVLNFTGRQRIKREHVEITITEPKYPQPPEISVRLDLSDYKLPPNARVFVEAYRQTAWQRFDYGTVGQIVAPEDRRLVDFGTGDGVLFRVKVVKTIDNNQEDALILAQADSVPANQDNRSRSLLCLVPDPELKEEPWKLVLPDPDDNNDTPEIRVSTHLVQDRYSFGRSPAFVSLAIPNIFRMILLNWLRGEPPEDDEWNQPRGLWFRLACAYAGSKDVPADIFGSDTHGEQEQWVDEVITAFCRRHGIDRSFRKWWKEDSAGGGGGAS